MQKEILEEKIPSLFIKFVIPGIVGMLVNAMYAIVDGIFIGNNVGELGLAAVNIQFPIFCINGAIAALFGVGASIWISIKRGQGKDVEAEKILGTAVFMLGTISLAISGTVLLFMKPIMSFLGASGEVLPLTMEYSKIIFYIAFFQMIGSALHPVIRADGRPSVAMKVGVISSIGNVVLDWIFVSVFPFGIKGAAFATGLCMTGACLYMLYYFTKGNSNIKIRVENLRFKPRLLKCVVVSGFVSFGIQISLGILSLIQNKLLLKYGTVIDVSVFAILGYISCISAQTLLGIAEGIQPIIGYNFGANNHNRVKEVLRLTVKVDLVVGFLFLLLFIFGGELLISAFNNNPEVVQLARKRLLMYLGGVPVVGLVYTYANYYQATKRDVYANLVSMGRSFIYYLPATLILPKIIGVNGVFLAASVADYLAVATVIILVFLEKRAENKKGISSSKENIIQF
ncbi:MAG: MATE family efflux transporter [Clostridium sp.]